MDDFRIRGVIDAEARGFHRAVDGVLKRFRDLRSDHLKTTATAHVLENQTRQLNRELERQSRILAGLTLQFTAVRNAMRTLALQTAIVGFASLTSSVLALGAGIVELTQQAALLGAAMGTVGVSGLMALGQAAVVTTLALKGVGKALITTGQDHEKAMAKLTKPARDFVHELMSMQTAFREIKLLAQVGLFDGLTRGVKAAKPALEPLKAVVYDTAQAMGYLGERIGDVVGRRAKDLKALGERNVVTLRRFGDAAINAGEGVLDVFRAADPFIGHVTAGIVTLSQKLKAAAADARKDGSLGHFFFELRKTWDTWTATFGNAGGALFNVFKAAAGPAQDVADAIKETTQQWETWTGSTAGQHQLREFFESSNRTLGSMARLVGAIVVGLARLSVAGGDNAVRFFDGLRTTVLPVLEQLAIQLNAGLFSHLMDLGGAFARLVAVALPGLQPVSDAVGHLVDAVTGLLNVTTPLIRALPDVAKLPAALLIGATVLGGWKKLTDLLALALLRLRMFFGLAAETPVWGPGLRQLTSMGGRMNAQQPAFAIAGGAAGGAAGGVMAGGASQLVALQRSVRYDAATTNRLLGNLRDEQSVSGLLGPGAAGARGKGGRFIPESQYASGRRTAAYREFQSIDKTQRGRLAGFAEGVGGATNAGLRRGVQLARPALAAGIGIAAVSGLVSGLSSNANNWKGRIQDAVAGATFGIVPSTSEKMGAAASKLAGGIQQNDVMGTRFKNPSASDRAFADLTTGAGREHVKGFIDQLAKAGDIAQDDKAKLVAMVDAYAARVDALGPQAAKLGDAIDKGLDLGGKSAQIVTDTDTIMRSFANMKAAGGKHIADLKRDVTTNMIAISGALDRHSESGRLALAKNFRLAAVAVRTSMKEGAIGTKQGAALIRKYLIDALLEVNPDWNRKQAGLYLHDKDPTTGRPISGPNTGKQGAAQGMLTRVAGAVGPDSVPLSVAGRNIVVAPGEDVAVFTRHQRKVVDQRLADIGGLGGLFSSVRTKHHMQGYASGGLVTGDTDYLPAVGTALEKMAAATHTPIFVRSGRRTMAEQAALYARYLAGTGNLAAKPSPNAPHVRGIAADISPGREKFGAIASRFGLGFTVPGESWHIQILQAVGEALAAAGAAPAQLHGVASGMSGMVGALTDAGLDKVHGAAQATLDAALSTMGGPTTGEPAPSGGGAKLGGGAAANRALGKHMAAAMGWVGAQWRALDQLWTGESGWRDDAQNPTSSAAGIPQDITGNLHGGAAGQIRWGLDYIKGRYGSPAKALSFWLSQNPHWYDMGGLLSFITGGQPPIPGRGSPPTVNPNDAVTPGSSKPSKPKKKPKPKKPYTSGPAIPNVSKIKGDKAKKPKKGWQSKYAGFAPAEGFDYIKAIIPNYEQLFETPMETAQNLLTNLQGQFDLSDEEAIVTLYDSGSFHDLSAFWAAHPDLAKTYAGQIDSFDVVNTGGYTVQGKFVPGVDQHVNELLTLMGVHTGAPDATAQGGLVGLLQGYIAAIRDQGLPHLAGARDLAVNRMRQLLTLWRFEHSEREHDITEIHKLSGGHGGWQQRVNDNDARIDRLHQFLRDIDEAAIGHRLTEEAKHKKAQAHNKIADLQAENRHLRDTKPAAKSKSVAHKIASLQGQRDEHAHELDFLAGSRDRFGNPPTGGIAGDQQKVIDDYNTELAAESQLVGKLIQVDLPTEQLEVARIAKEIGDWRGTTVVLPNITATQSDNQAEINDLLAQQNDDLRRNLALMGQQFKVFQGFAPLVGARMLGAFAHGGVISETGMALVHKHERMTVDTDPEGPFGSQIKVGGTNVDANVALHLHGELAQLMRLVDARVNGRAATVASQDLGHRSRMLTIAPGGGGTR